MLIDAALPSFLSSPGPIVKLWSLNKIIPNWCQWLSLPRGAARRLCLSSLMSTRALIQLHYAHTATHRRYIYIVQQKMDVLSVRVDSKYIYGWLWVLFFGVKLQDFFFNVLFIYNYFSNLNLPHPLRTKLQLAFITHEAPSGFNRKVVQRRNHTEP